MSILEHAVQVASQDDFEPGKLMGLPKTHFPSEFGKVLENHEKYTLEWHTFMVFSRFEKYLSRTPLPLCLDNAHFRLFLAIHDLGKPKAEKEGDKRKQSVCNPMPFEEHCPKEPFISNASGEVLESLLTDDPVGPYLRYEGVDIGRYLEKLNGMHGRVSWAPKREYMELLLTCQMSDAGSHARDAGGIPSLDYHFDFRTGSMGFTARSKPLVDVLVDRFTISQTDVCPNDSNKDSIPMAGYPLQLIENQPFIVHDGLTILIDAGVTVTIALQPIPPFMGLDHVTQTANGGRTYRLSGT